MKRRRVNLRTLMGAFLCLFLVVRPALAPAQPVELTGKVQARENRGNGLTTFYLLTAEGKVRIWVHITHPDKDEIEAALRRAADAGAEIRVEGDLEPGPERSIRISGMAGLE